jgi:phosphoribosyl 1,2-cyclic phosphodiesterase
VQREVASGIASAAEVEDQHHPTHFGGYAFSEFRERSSRKRAALIQIGKAMTDQ